MRLIKFFTYNEYLLESLTNVTLYFSNVSNFNDPFEGVFRYKIYEDDNRFKNFYLHEFGGNPALLNYFLQNKKEFEEKLNRTFKWKFENNGVCCFSDEIKKTDILMWSNYADNHKGICLIFNDKIRFLFKDEKTSNIIVGEPSGPYKIQYIKKYLDEYPDARELTVNTFLTSKFNIWENEKEFRFISGSNGNHFFYKESLEEVIFGLRTSNDAKYTIKNIVSRNFPNIKYKKIILKKDEFDIEVVDDIE